MFDNLNEYFADDCTDYFYDESFAFCKRILVFFTDEEWRAFRQIAKTKEDEWKIRFIYCIDQDMGYQGYCTLLQMLDERDAVVEHVLDSLRSFDLETYKDRMIADGFVDKAKSLLPTASSPARCVLTAFLGQFENNE